jgi:hypothetical protein
MAHDCLERALAVARPPFSTIPERRLAVLVLISPSKRLLDICSEAVRFVIAGRIEVASVQDATTVVAAQRPFAIVLDEDVFAFDPQEFQALGRDVGAQIITVSGQAPHDALMSRLLPELKAAFRRWEQRDESV